MIQKGTLLLAFLLAFTLLAAPVSAEGLFTLDTFPIVTEPLTLTFAVNQHPVHCEFNDMPVWQEYERMTGIHIEWLHIPMSNFTERRNIMFATGDLPDAFYKASMNISDLTKYSSEGFLTPLNALIEECGPSLKALYEAYPDVQKVLTMEDGQMYSTAYVNTHPALAVGGRLFLNWEWMERLNLAMPATTDELTDLLRAFRDSDANGNGDTQDEIPLSGEGGLANLIGTFKGAWGLGNRGGTHGNVDMGADGKLRFIPATDAYRELIGYLRTLYAEKLIDQEIFTTTYEAFLANATNNRIGVMSAVNSQFAGEYEKNYKGLDAALIGPHGDQLAVGNAAVFNAGAFVICANNEHPKETLRWVDYFYGEAGAELLFLVEKGTVYETDENGRNYYLDFVTNSPDGRTMGQVLGYYTSWGGGGSPAIIMDNYFIGGETQPIPLAAAKALEPFKPEVVWEAFNYTVEENELLGALTNDIESYIKEMCAQFVTGKSSLEDQWDTYLTELEKMGLAEYMALYETAYARYEGK